MNNNELRNKLILPEGSIKSIIDVRHLTGDKERDQWIQFLQNMDAQYHLTVIFSYGTTQRKCREHLNRLLKYTNLKIYKQRYSRGESYLNGVAVMEDTKQMDSVHFHVLIKSSDYLPNKVRMLEILENSMSASNRNEAFKIEKLQLDSYYSSFDTSIENYITKNFNRLSSEHNARDRFGLLGTDSVIFGELGSLSNYGNGYTNSLRRHTAS
jgi:hypothetical protein